VTGTGPLEELRSTAGKLAEAADVLGVPVGEVVDGARKRTAEIKALRDEIGDLRRQLAIGQASTLVAQAVDGVVVARVDGLDRDGDRDLTVAARDADGIEAVVLGAAPEGGGAALVAATVKGGRFHAGELIAEASRLIKGGGGKGEDLAVAGGKDPAGIPSALDAVRGAAEAMARSG